MAYTRTKKSLVIPGDTPVTLPARYRSIGVGRGDVTVYSASVTHTASVPMHPSLVEDITVNDGTYEYRIIEVKEILGKYRLTLERI